MAIYRLETSIIGRRAKDKAGKPIPGQQISVVAKAAYRSGNKLRDEQTERLFNYSARGREVIHSEILSPKNAPEWLQADQSNKKGQRELRQRLWNTIEKVEKRKDSQLAREFLISLPKELTREEQIEVIREFCETEILSKGFVADIAIHRSKDGQNPHAHLLTSLRPVEADNVVGLGFGKKPSMDGKFNGRGAAGIGAKNDLEAWRASWETYANRALERAGREERIDHRSLKDRGIDRTAEPKIGVDAMAMQRKGIEEDPEAVKRARHIRLENEVMPHFRDIEQTGEVAQLGASASWWDRSTLFITQLRDNARGFVKGTWQRFVRSFRASEPESGTNFEPSR